MGIRDMLKKKGDGDDESAYPAQPPPRPAPAEPLETPEFTFIRSDTHSQEVIHPPSIPPQYYVNDDKSGTHLRADDSASRQQHQHRGFDVFKSSRSRSASVSSKTSTTGGGSDRREDGKNKEESVARRLSHRLHLHRSPSSSSHVPADLPEIVVPDEDADGGDRIGGGASSSTLGGSSPGGGGGGHSPAVSAAVESQWEKRATILALENERQRNSRPSTPDSGRLGSRGRGAAGASRSRSNSAVSSKELDADIQEAIRLHEEGQLEQSTRMFKILADPRGYNNPLSQVLYGLALRHGWGCAPDTEAAVNYLSAAASNAAAVEEMALSAGINKGGAAKGELVLAIFELANCFRHGWGLEKDPVAAKQYYETAANLGDTDAMNEVAWCYLEGFGCKKDKFASAKYYRLAEQNGNKTLGNTWIWKEKYDPDKQPPQKKK